MAYFEMTETDLSELLDAMNPLPLLAINCGMPRSRQEKANAAWVRLGKKKKKKMGFDPMSARPNGKGVRFFSADIIAQGGAA